MTKPAANSILAALEIANGATIVGIRRIPLDPATPSAGDPIQFSEILIELNAESERHSIWRDVLRGDLATADPQQVDDIKIAITQRSRLAETYRLAMRIIETCRADPVIRRRMKEIERERVSQEAEPADEE